MKINFLRNDIKKDLLYSELKKIESSEIDDEFNQHEFKATTKKVLQKFEYFFISFEIKGIDNLQDLLLSSIRHIHYKSFDSEDIEFSELDSALEDEEIKYTYELLQTNTLVLSNNLKKEYPDDDLSFDLDYITPLSRKKDCICTMSLNEFFKFIQTCFKYDELSDIITSFLEIEDEELNDMVSEMIYISNVIKGDELFLLEPIDPMIKGEIEDAGTMSSVIETDIDSLPQDFDLPKQIDLHTVSCSSITMFKYLLNTDIRNKIMMENIYKALIDNYDENINIILPARLLNSAYYEFIIEHINLSIGLMNLINERTANVKDMLLVQLGSFMKYFRYSNNVFKDAKFIKEQQEKCEHTELLALMNERLNILKETYLEKYYL